MPNCYIIEAPISTPAARATTQRNRKPHPRDARAYLPALRWQGPTSRERGRQQRNKKPLRVFLLRPSQQVQGPFIQVWGFRLTPVWLKRLAPRVKVQKLRYDKVSLMLSKSKEFGVEVEVGGGGCGAKGVEEQGRLTRCIGPYITKPLPERFDAYGFHHQNFVSFSYDFISYLWFLHRCWLHALWFLHRCCLQIMIMSVGEVDFT